ncbi:hypothetical protein [Bacteroides congonensis]|uniref:hypothetical protein n=1 Tax=Bacteroides congonensis TaxID=1871006 RepID=UPI000932CB76|nr:hypothetical protein [Bacteroides congonensis]
MKKLNFNLKLNIKSIIYYERLTGKPFSTFTGSEEDVIPLLYCMLVANNDFKRTYEETIQYLFTDEKFVEEINSRLQKIFLFESQFFNKEEVDEKLPSQNNTQNKEESNKVYIYQLVPILVMDCNLDIDYVLNEMHYSEIDSYIKYRDDKNKNRLEEKRLFTYLTIMPHINAKKLTVNELLPFSWEKEEKEKEGLKVIDNHKDKLHQFMNSGQIEWKQPTE